MTPRIIWSSIFALLCSTNVYAQGASECGEVLVQQTSNLKDNYRQSLAWLKTIDTRNYEVAKRTQRFSPNSFMPTTARLIAKETHF
ncbi:hypothetical protein [Sphingomonas sp. 22R3R2A-7]|uniref:hypothetical protein n=1 Tax=Sphingomonas sp. 22R3R2A-7 TaxID=3050230 RepID=UPI002FE1B5E1